MFDNGYHNTYRFEDLTGCEGKRLPTPLPPTPAPPTPMPLEKKTRLAARAAKKVQRQQEQEKRRRERANGCAEFCATHTAAWYSKCAWNSCSACDRCKDYRRLDSNNFV